MALGVNRGKAPLLAYGAIQDLDASPWISVGTPGLTPGQSDPFGGTDGVTVNDDSAGAVEGLQGPSAAVKSGVPVPITVFLKQGTSSVSHFVLRDVTAGNDRTVFQVTWSTKVVTVLSGTGSIGGLISVGGSWWLAIVSGTPPNANAYAIRLLGATTTASATGTTVYFVRSALITAEAIDRANAWSEPRIGSRFIQGADGAEDAWITGQDHRLSGTVRWIPAEVQDTPRPASAWNGQGGLGAGIGVGWNDFLTSWGRDKQTFLWVPDRSIASTHVSSYLEEPMKGEPSLEQDFSRSLNFRFRSSDGSQYSGY